MKPFKHVNAKTVNEAVKLLENSRGKARLISGGTDLLGILKDKILPDYPETVINIKTVPGLDHISEDADGLRIGALSTLADIAQSPAVRAKYKVLAEAAAAVATPQIRRMGTIGGNLCQDVRCWYYRYPEQIGGRINCYLKGGQGCYAMNAENRYHSVFGGLRAGNTPCQSACPGGIDIPSCLCEIREGNLHKAAGIILAANPMPSITGRVCPHFCEQQCNRGGIDESVAVRDIERFMGDYIIEHAGELVIPPETDTGKSVAIVGSGPAGLSAAYYLRMSGHSVTVFEASAKPGGMMRECIPDFRLPGNILDAEINRIRSLGVDLKVNAGIQSIDGLFQQGYNAVFLALGAHRSRRLKIRGEDLPGVMDGISFMKAVNLGEQVPPGDKVAVIGGGNTAIDSARAALRLGAGDVTVIYRRTRAEMPSGADEVGEALNEGIKIIFQAAPSKIERRDGRLNLTCTRMEPGELDNSGRRLPVPVKGSEFSMGFSSIIVAIGQTPDIPNEFGLRAGRGKTIRVSDTQATERQGVWAGGDMATGSATVIEAIAAGKRAAASINLYLGEKEIKTEDKGGKGIEPFLRFNGNCIEKTSRSRMPKLPITGRRMDVEDILGLSSDDIKADADRCFNCGCVSVNPSDIGVALLALDAKLRVSGTGGSRTISIGEFFGCLGNVLEADEMITEIRIAGTQENARQTFIKFRLRESVDFPIVSVASIITVHGGVCKDARIVLGSVAPRPVRAIESEETIKGKSINEATAKEAAEAAVIHAIPLSRNAYKVEIAKTLVKRAIMKGLLSGEETS